MTAVDLTTVIPGFRRPANAGARPIVLNDWAARDPHAVSGQSLALDYYGWMDEGRLVTRTAEFEAVFALYFFRRIG